MTSAGAIEQRDWLAFAGVMALSAILLSINPPGYYGGRWDDGRYLEAALRWIASGPVLGTEHWSLRWPVVLPAAAVIELFGRNSLAIALPGLAAFAALLALVFWATRRVLGRATAVVATLAVATTSEILLSATRLNADVAEALFWVGAACAFVCAARARGRLQIRWLVVTGIAAGLAWATRETSISLLIALGIALVAGAAVPRRRFVWIAAGFLLIFLPEHLLLWQISGDPLYRLHTDLNHTALPSTNMRGLAAEGQSAPMNVDIMARWIGVGPVRVCYLIDPWINLFLNLRYGLVFLLAGAFVAAAAVRRCLDRTQWRTIAVLTGLAALHIAVTIYIVATDPKPRMFMPSIVAACVIVGIVAPALWRSGARRWLAVAAVLKLVAVLGSIDTIPLYNRQYPMLAGVAMARVDGPVHAKRWTLSKLALADANLRARLKAGNPPIGGVQLALSRSGDPLGDAVPDPALRWQQVERIQSNRRPLLVRLALALPRSLVPAQRRQALLDQSPAATLYRRLPDAPLPKPPSAR